VRTSEHATTTHRPILEIVYTQGVQPVFVRSPMWGRF
jgi:hypothetical protein